MDDETPGFILIRIGIRPADIAVPRIIHIPGRIAGSQVPEGGEQGDPEGPGLTEESPALSVAFSAMPENAKQGDPGWTGAYR